MGLTAVGTVRSHALVAQGGSSSMCTSRRHVAVGMTVRRGHGDRCCNAGAAGLVVVDLHGGLCLDAFARGRRHRVRAFLLVGGVGACTLDSLLLGTAHAITVGLAVAVVLVAVADGAAA